MSMRVLVTGGTGFVGSHSVAALLAAGHDVRLLVRSPDRIGPALRPLGVTADVDHVVGDVTDPDSVNRALRGCDAVLHAAAVYDLDARGATVTPDSPLSTLPGAYTRSKAASEAVARQLQAGGAPVVIVQPGGVLGPHDPHCGDQTRRLRDILRGWYPLWPSGGFQIADIRDVAQVHAAVLSPGAGPRRYLVPGNFVDGATMYATLRELTGRRLPVAVVPDALIVPLAWTTSAQQWLHETGRITARQAGRAVG